MGKKLQLPFYTVVTDQLGHRQKIHKCCKADAEKEIRPATATERREYLKRWGANKIAAQRDRLTERATYCAKHFALGGLRSVCWAAGKANDWIDPHIFGLCDKRPELTLYPRNLRVGS